MASYTKTALITGITGQAGSWLAEYLRSRDYLVFGLYRRSSSSLGQNHRLQKLLLDPGVEFLQGDIEDGRSLEDALEYSRPDEIYNLAAMSFVGTSFVQPSKTLSTTGSAIVNLLEAVRKYTRGKRPKIFQASTSEMFGTSWTGDSQEGVFHSLVPVSHADILKFSPYQDEQTPFYPVSPYAVAKLAAHHLCNIYRQSYGLWISCGIMFNFESSRRGEEFVTKKITKAIAKRLVRGTGELRLGNLNSYRDWTDARDTVRAMHLLLQQDSPRDVCVGSGNRYRVSDFLGIALRLANSSLNPVIDPSLYRPCEVPYLCSNPSLITSLGWKPNISFGKMIQDMLEFDIEQERKQA